MEEKEEEEHGAPGRICRPPRAGRSPPTPASLAGSPQASPPCHPLDARAGICRLASTGTRRPNKSSIDSDRPSAHRWPRSFHELFFLDRQCRPPYHGTAAGLPPPLGIIITKPRRRSIFPPAQQAAHQAPLQRRPTTSFRRARPPHRAARLRASCTPAPDSSRASPTATSSAALARPWLRSRTPASTTARQNGLCSARPANSTRPARRLRQITTAPEGSSPSAQPRAVHAPAPSATRPRRAPQARSQTTHPPLSPDRIAGPQLAYSRAHATISFRSCNKSARPGSAAQSPPAVPLCAPRQCRPIPTDSAGLQYCC
nr:uncharacterized protein LOC127321534 [Lolium perenne]